MTKQQIRLLLKDLSELEFLSGAEMVETHISWVLLCREEVFKIKKPVQFSFLDFSTLEKRKHFCEREVELNNRLTHGVYLGVFPVTLQGRKWSIGGEGTVVDYAVKMRKLNPGYRMDLLLDRNKVTRENIYEVAERLVLFHQEAPVVHSMDYHLASHQFDDLLHEHAFVQSHLGKAWAGVVERAVTHSRQYIETNLDFFKRRANAGMVIDGHGDLHSGNIFLTPEPVIFDCIEFNDQLRQVDVLNELAFLYMDLIVRGHPELGQAFLDRYRLNREVMDGPKDQELFSYFVAYRANVRAKITLIEAKAIQNSFERDKKLSNVVKYLELMRGFS